MHQNYSLDSPTPLTPYTIQSPIQVNDKVFATFSSAWRKEISIPVLATEKILKIIDEYEQFKPRLQQKQKELATLLNYNSKLFEAMEKFRVHERKLIDRCNALSNLYVKSFKKYCESKNWDLNPNQFKQIPSVFDKFSMKDWKVEPDPIKVPQIDQKYSLQLFEIIQKHYLKSDFVMPELFEEKITSLGSKSRVTNFSNVEIGWKQKDKQFNFVNKKMSEYQDLKVRIANFEKAIPNASQKNMFDLLSERKILEGDIRLLNMEVDLIEKRHQSQVGRANSEKDGEFIKAVERLHSSLENMSQGKLKEYIEKEKEIRKGIKKKELKERKKFENYHQNLKEENSDMKEEIQQLKEKISELERLNSEYRAEFQYMNIKHSMKKQNISQSASFVNDETFNFGEKLSRKDKQYSKKLEAECKKMQEELKGYKTSSQNWKLEEDLIKEANSNLEEIISRLSSLKQTMEKDNTLQIEGNNKSLNPSFGLTEIMGSSKSLADRPAKEVQSKVKVLRGMVEDFWKEFVSNQMKENYNIDHLIEYRNRNMDQSHSIAPSLMPELNLLLEKSDLNRTDINGAYNFNLDKSNNNVGVPDENFSKHWESKGRTKVYNDLTVRVSSPSSKRPSSQEFVEEENSEALNSKNHPIYSHSPTSPNSVSMTGGIGHAILGPIQEESKVDESKLERGDSDINSNKVKSEKNSLKNSVSIKQQNNGKNEPLIQAVENGKNAPLIEAVEKSQSQRLQRKKTIVKSTQAKQAKDKTQEVDPGDNRNILEQSYTIEQDNKDGLIITKANFNQAIEEKQLLRIMDHGSRLMKDGENAESNLEKVALEKRGSKELTVSNLSDENATKFVGDYKSIIRKKDSEEFMQLSQLELNRSILLETKIKEIEDLLVVKEKELKQTSSENARLKSRLETLTSELDSAKQKISQLELCTVEGQSSLHQAKELGQKRAQTNSREHFGLASGESIDAKDFHETINDRKSRSGPIEIVAKSVEESSDLQTNPFSHAKNSRNPNLLKYETESSVQTSQFRQLDSPQKLKLVRKNDEYKGGVQQTDKQSPVSIRQGNFTVKNQDKELIAELAFRMQSLIERAFCYFEREQNLKQEFHFMSSDGSEVLSQALTLACEACKSFGLLEKFESTEFEVIGEAIISEISKAEQFRSNLKQRNVHDPTTNPNTAKKFLRRAQTSQEGQQMVHEPIKLNSERSERLMIPQATIEERSKQESFYNLSEHYQEKTEKEGQLKYFKNDDEYQSEISMVKTSKNTVISPKNLKSNNQEVISGHFISEDSIPIPEDSRVDIQMPSPEKFSQVPTRKGQTRSKGELKNSNTEPVYEGGVYQCQDNSSINIMISTQKNLSKKQVMLSEQQLNPAIVEVADNECSINKSLKDELQNSPIKIESPKLFKYTESRIIGSEKESLKNLKGSKSDHKRSKIQVNDGSKPSEVKKTRNIHSKEQSSIRIKISQTEEGDHAEEAIGSNFLTVVEETDKQPQDSTKKYEEGSACILGKEGERSSSVSGTFELASITDESIPFVESEDKQTKLMLQDIEEGFSRRYMKRSKDSKAESYVPSEKNQSKVEEEPSSIFLKDIDGPSVSQDSDLRKELKELYCRYKQVCESLKLEEQRNKNYQCEYQRYIKDLNLQQRDSERLKMQEKLFYSEKQIRELQNFISEIEKEHQQEIKHWVRKCEKLCQEMLVTMDKERKLC